MSKLVTCVNSKNYNLTQGREYEVDVDPQNRDRYIMRNDRNLQSRYATNLFEDVVIPEPEPVRVRLPIEQSIHEMRIVDNTINISFYENENVTFTGFGLSLKNGRLNCSCGLTELSGISGYSGVKVNLENSLPADVTLTEADKIMICNRIFSRQLSNITSDINYGGVILSTNTNCNNFEQIDEVMETFNVTSSRMINPNSNNEIIVYVLNLEAEVEEEVDEDFEEIH